LYWIHAGTNAIYVDDGTDRFDITPTSAPTGTSSDRWTGGPFNGVYVLSNGVDAPIYWDGDTAGEFDALPNWPSGHLCKSLRPYKNFLVALDVTKSGTRYPFRVLWSAIADPGAVPPRWNIADPTRESGEIDIEGAAGPVIDALPLGDEFIIYTSASTHRMRYVGGQSVMAFTGVIGGKGMLARHCAAATPMGHVVLTTGDVVLQAEGPPRSIANARVRRTIFDALDNTHAESAAFVVTNPAKNEVLFCYPTSGSSTCNIAAVWNWLDDTWTFRALRSVTAGAFGQVPQSLGPRWSSLATETWIATIRSWGGNLAGPNDQHLVLGHAIPALSLYGFGDRDLGVSYVSQAERVGMHLGDQQTVKFLRAVWPRIDGADGAVVNIQVGASPRSDYPPTWTDAVPYTVGTSEKIDCRTSGRFLALRVTSVDDSAWRLRGIDLDIVPRGRR
jgi:hypothetical protein